MRISTNTIYESGATRVSELQVALLRTQQQISANRRILTPSDDPIASARALEVSQSQSMNAQYATNRTYATNALSLQESVLQSVTSLIQDVQTQVVEAGNAAYDDTQRKYIATALRGRLDELIGLANSKDSEGNYLFSGFQTSTKPFSTTPTGASYVGDQGQRNLQVGSARLMSISDSGDMIFERIASTGTYVTAANAANAGTVISSAVVVTDASQLTGHNYEVVFSNGGADYAIFDVTTDPGKTTPIQSGAYASPQQLTVDGLQFSISGAPADGDVLSIRKSGAQSIFETINDLIGLLETPTNTTVNKQNLTYGLGVANTNLSNALDNVLTVRASVGTRLKELETLDAAGEDRDIQYAQTLSDLQDLDYVKAISELSLKATSLEAAQKSYLKIMDLSLFNYI